MGSLSLQADAAVARDTVLDELVPRGLRLDHPIPVIEDDGALAGEIPLEALATAMAADESAEAANPGERGASAR